MAAYANLHIAFEQMRVRALRVLHGSPVPDGESDVNSEPPRVLVLGPENSGKTTVCKILVNYAVRAGQGWSPLLVNVDPSEVCCCSFFHSRQNSSVRATALIIDLIAVHFRVAGLLQEPCQSHLYIHRSQPVLPPTPWALQPHRLPRPCLRMHCSLSSTGMVMQKPKGILC